MRPNTATATIAVVLLILMGVVMVTSSLQESAVVDEVAHIPSGVTYITEHDSRLNPEHPPLLKDLAGLAVVAWSAITKTDLHIPTDQPFWTDDLNGQWSFGYSFLYDVGNDADTIIQVARMPLIVMTLLIGWLLFTWTRRRHGNIAGLFALVLYTFSPTIIAHGRYVTTDVGVMGAFLLSIITFTHFLKRPTRKNLIIAGTCLGIAALVKFSVILLAPLFAIIGVLWTIRGMVRARRRSAMADSERGMIAEGLIWIGSFVVIIIIAIVVVSVVYIPHIWNYPQEKQIEEINGHLATHGNDLGVAIVKWSAQHTLTRPFAQYGVGALMVTQRLVGGNTTYFLGNVNNVGWTSYFPIVYSIKTPLALSALTIIALFTALWKMRRFWMQPATRISDWFGSHIEEATALSFIGLYWYASVSGPLNIGIRHLLPTFPFVYFLIAGMLRHWLHSTKNALETRNPWQMIKILLVNAARTTGKVVVIAGLLLWYAGSSLTSYPFYLPYFNELAGNPPEGQDYVVDSNLDWGQDMKRLQQFVQERGIKTIAVDYFGGAKAEYYLGDAYVPHTRKPTTGWNAISATFLKGGQANPTDNYTALTGESTDHYMWLTSIEPETVIGRSIFVYYIPEQ